MENMSTLYHRYEWINYKLQRETYRQQMAGRTTKLKQFIPCPVGLVFSAALGKYPIPVMIEVMQEAEMVRCKCHPGLDVWQLYAEAVREFPA